MKIIICGVFLICFELVIVRSENNESTHYLSENKFPIEPSDLRGRAEYSDRIEMISTNADSDASFNDDDNIEEDDFMTAELRNHVYENLEELTKSDELYYERINQGQIANGGQFPFQVGLQIRRREERQYWCGGALINAEWVLTAAHCLDKSSYVVVILGAQERKLVDEIGRITKPTGPENMFVHKLWNPSTLANDIALIRLTPPIEFTERIYPIRLPTLEDTKKSYNGTQAWISGWGRYFKKCKKLSPSLRFALGQILTNDECSESFSTLILDSHICFDGKNRQGVCRGDSGGPLFIRGADGGTKLIGLASFGRGCGSRVPGAFTRITHYLDWIGRITGIRVREGDVSGPARIQGGV